MCCSSLKTKTFVAAKIAVDILSSAMDFLARFFQLLWIPIGLALSTVFIYSWLAGSAFYIKSKMIQYKGEVELFAGIDAFPEVYSAMVVISGLASGLFFAGLLRFVASEKLVFNIVLFFSVLLLIVVPESAGSELMHELFSIHNEFRPHAAGLWRIFSWCPFITP